MSARAIRLISAARRAVRPKANITVSEWADAHRMLSEESDAEPGPWHTSRNPLTRGIMDALSETAPHNKVVFMGPTQLAKTAIATNFVGYIIAHAKGPCALFMPTENTLADWVTQKFTPMAKDTRVVAEALAKKGSGDSNARRRGFVGGDLFFRTAGSEADLSSVSLRFVIADEVDKYQSSDKGDTLKKIGDRITSFESSGGKLYVCSSPTIKDASIIEAEFEGGDQHRYHVSCPHCGALQHLKWSNLQWQLIEGLDKRVRDAWYGCSECGVLIEEHHKTEMLREHGHGGKARWIADNPGAPYPSFHANALYMPDGLGKTWKALAQEWLEAQGDHAKLMHFINSRLAETYRHAGSDIKPKTLSARAEPYSLRTVPAGCLYITVGVDVQSGADARLELQVLGHGAGKRVWTLDYHVIPGNPSGDEVWDALAGYVNDIAYTNRHGKTLRSEACAIDIGGHHTHDVYAFVRSNRVLRPMAVQGASRPGKIILGKPTAQDVNWRGRTIKGGVKLYQIGTDTAKHYLFGLLQDDADKPAEERKIRFSQDLEEGYYDGLVSETFNPRKNRYEKKKGKRNEPLDTWVYALAASHHPELYLHKRTKASWEQRAAMLEPEDRPPAPEPEPLHPMADPVAAAKKKKAKRSTGNFATRW